MVRGTKSGDEVLEYSDVIDMRKEVKLKADGLQEYLAARQVLIEESLFLLTCC